GDDIRSPNRQPAPPLEHAAFRTTGRCPRVKPRPGIFAQLVVASLLQWRDGKTDEREDTDLPGPGLERRAQAPNRLRVLSDGSWQRVWWHSMPTSAGMLLRRQPSSAKPG